jgi:hypothetical protein
MSGFLPTAFTASSARNRSSSWSVNAATSTPLAKIALSVVKTFAASPPRIAPSRSARWEPRASPITAATSPSDSPFALNEMSWSSRLSASRIPPWAERATAARTGVVDLELLAVDDLAEAAGRCRRS